MLSLFGGTLSELHAIFFATARDVKVCQSFLLLASKEMIFVIYALLKYGRYDCCGLLVMCRKCEGLNKIQFRSFD